MASFGEEFAVGLLAVILYVLPIVGLVTTIVTNNAWWLWLCLPLVIFL